MYNSYNEEKKEVSQTKISPHLLRRVQTITGIQGAMYPMATEEETTEEETTEEETRSERFPKPKATITSHLEEALAVKARAKDLMEYYEDLDDVCLTKEYPGSAMLKRAAFKDICEILEVPRAALDEWSAVRRKAHRGEAD